jgi:hypothetical protein
VGDRLTVSVVATDFQRRWIEQEYRDALIGAGSFAFDTSVQWVAVTVRKTTP